MKLKELLSLNIQTYLIFGSGHHAEVAEQTV